MSDPHLMALKESIKMCVKAHIRNGGSPSQVVRMFMDLGMRQDVAARTFAILFPEAKGIGWAGLVAWLRTDDPVPMRPEDYPALSLVLVRHGFAFTEGGAKMAIRDGLIYVDQLQMTSDLQLSPGSEHIIERRGDEREMVLNVIVSNDGKSTTDRAA